MNEPDIDIDKLLKALHVLDLVSGPRERQRTKSMSMMMMHAVGLCRIKKEHYQECLRELRTLVDYERSRSEDNDRVLSEHDLEPLDALIKLVEIIVNLHDTLRAPTLSTYKLITRANQERIDKESTHKN